MGEMAKIILVADDTSAIRKDSDCRLLLAVC